jgi:septal ring factor EnvC (AmiA/AmiB activator)
MTAQRQYIPFFSKPVSPASKFFWYTGLYPPHRKLLIIYNLQASKRPASRRFPASHSLKQMRHMFKQMRHMLKQMGHMFKQMRHMLKQMSRMFKQMQHMLKQMSRMFKQMRHNFNPSRILPDYKF